MVSCKLTGFYKLLLFSGVFKRSYAQLTGILSDLREGISVLFWRQKKFSRSFAGSKL